MDAVPILGREARRFAARRGLRLVVEFSDRSEAVYLHVHREGRWHGIRIASHEPVYECSRDYEQLLVAALETPDRVSELRDLLLRSVEKGGVVVADPLSVRAALVKATIAGRAATGRWRSSAAEQSAIRHRLNARAKWTAEIEDTFSTGEVAE